MALLPKLLVLLPALLAIVKSDFPFDYNLDLVDIERPEPRNDDTSFRLPEDFDPIHCTIEITPYFEEAPEEKEPFTFDGEATLTIRALRDGLTNVIVQDNVRRVIRVSLTNSLGESLEHETDSFERIREFFFLRINLRDGVTLSSGEVYTLYIEYVGNINETPLSRGMFRGNYRDQNGNIRWYAATHLQPTHSRQLFPSFDEPGFKSTFDIIVNRPATFSPTFSNMRLREENDLGDRVREVFETTPRMSAYLISVHISDGFEVIADNGNEETSYRIIARPEARGQGAYALEVGPPLTAWFDNYFEIGYYTMAEGIRNDQLATPFWASGATENWGLVSYRELRLLFEEGETNALDKMSIATITAHELAHKWFGNYITCRWWDNVWINEGFASYFEYFGMDGVDRSMELEDQFNLMYLQSALASDATAGTRALRHPVNSPTEVTGHFSGISYTKGASLLLMLKHFVTEEVFRRSLNVFLVDRAYEHAFPEDLYRAFQNVTSEAGPLPNNVDIASFMSTWVDQRGYPVLEVSVNMETGAVGLRQERFYISSTAEQTDEIWPLPLTYTTGNNPDFDNLTVSYVLTGRDAEIFKQPGHEWVIFNVQQKGIYRVNYDDHNWEMIAAALRRNATSIHHLNRAQIVDDVFALMRSERLTYLLGFQVLEFLKEDTNYYSWYPAITGFNWLRNRFLHLSDPLTEFDRILLEYLDEVIESVGYNVRSGESLTETLHRFFILSFACNVGHQGCVEDATTKFRAFIDNGVAVDPNLRRHVFCVGLREGSYEDWERIRQRRLASNNQADEVAMLRALGCTANERAVNEFLEMITTDDVKAQDRVNALTWLYAGNRNNARLALEYLKEDGNVAKIREGVVLPAWFDNVLLGLASYLDEEGLDDMEQWLEANQETVPEFRVGLSGIASARSSMQWGTDRHETILYGMRGSASITLPGITLLFATILAFLLK